MGKSMKSKYMKRKRMVEEKFDDQNFRVLWNFTTIDPKSIFSL